MKLLKLILVFAFLLFIIPIAKADDVNLGVDVFSSGAGAAPPNITNFQASGSDKQIKLTWDNPLSNFQGVKIQRKTDYYPSTVNDGDNIYHGADTSFTDTGLTNGTRYYYTAFSYGEKAERYSSGAIASAVPWVTELIVTEEEDLPILPPETETGEETTQETTTGKEKIEVSDFDFFIQEELGWIQIPEVEKYHFFTGDELLSSISKDIFAKEVSVIILSFGSSSYLLTDKDDKYQTLIQLPAIKGDYSIVINIVFKDGTMTTLNSTALVDPYGYVYKYSKGFFSILASNVVDETRISGAKVSLYFYDRNKKQWQLWDAEKYKQENPQETNQSGEYSFMVPEGKYYLEVQKRGYRLLKTEEFEVKNQIINKNLELKPYLSNNVVILLIFLIIAGGVITFILVRRAKK